VCGLAGVAGMKVEEIVSGLTSVSVGQRAVYVLIGVQAAFVEQSLFHAVAHAMVWFVAGGL
jgi:hypothetical protein